MNKHILMAMDSLANPGKYTFEQLRENRDDAYADYDAVYAAYAAADAADAAYIFAVYAYNPTYANNVNANYWLNRYFKRSGENKQDYIDEINKGYKHE